MSLHSNRLMSFYRLNKSICNCAEDDKERLSNHLHATVYKGASAYILASKTTIAVDSPWVSCDHTFRLLGHIGLTNTQGCSVFQILMGLS